MIIVLNATVGVARLRTLTAQWPLVPSIGQNLQPFTSIGDVSICMKKYRVGRKPQTNKLMATEQ